jgi:hypothetical protein
MPNSEVSLTEINRVARDEMLAPEVSPTTNSEVLSHASSIRSQSSSELTHFFIEYSKSKQLIGFKQSN